MTEIGLQRLPGSAYPEPQTRGLKYGSLWLTFHGLQWPYLPSTFGRNRFVVGMSGWGWVDTSYEKFAPWGPNPNLEYEPDHLLEAAGRACCCGSRRPIRSTIGSSQGQVELVGTGDQTISRSDVGGADTDDLWLRVGQWNKWDFQVGRFEGWEVFHLGMGLDQNTFERQGAVGLGESAYAIGFYGLTDNQFRPQGAAGNLAFHYYPLPVLAVRAAGHGRHAARRTRRRGPTGGDPRFRLAEAEGRRGVAAHHRSECLRRDRHHLQGRRRRDPVRLRAAHRVRAERSSRDDPDRGQHGQT